MIGAITKHNPKLQVVFVIAALALLAHPAVVADTGGRLQGGVGNTDTRYAPTGTLELAPAGSGIKLTAWRGERVNAQIVVTAGTPQANVRVESAVLSNGRDSIPVQANFVRYTLGNVTGDEWKNPCGVQTNFTNIQPHGDILDTESRLTLAAGANRPIWLTMDVPASVAPGNYAGTLTVRTDTGALEFPIALDVLAATLRAPKDWRFHLDLWQQPEAVARYHRVPLWSPEHFALLKPLMKRLADAGQKTITCSLYHEPWGAQTYDRIPGMVEWRKKADGSWAYDYSIFDKWVAFMSDEVGLGQARIHCYTMIPWSPKFRYTDEAKQATVEVELSPTSSFRWGVLKAKQATVEVELSPGTPEYDEYWGRFLKDFSRHLASKGWLERTRIGMDERPDKLMRGALATLAKHAPELKVASAIDHPSELTRDIDDISVGIRPGFTFPVAEPSVRRQAGKRTTFYVCCVPNRPNTFVFSPPAEAEWLGLFAAANGFDGFLRWAYCSWVEDPLVSTDYTKWPSGDCFLVYPGNRSSVRFERLRDGIEDFEKIRLLREWATAAPLPDKQASLDRLDNVLKEFSCPRGFQAGVHAEDVRRAVEAINAAARSLAPAAFTALIPQPRQMEVKQGAFVLSANTQITFAGRETEAQRLAASLRPATGFALPVTAASTSTAKSEMRLRLNPELTGTLGDEGYTLSVTPERIEITAAADAGLFYGGQTLLQLLPAEIFTRERVSGVTWRIPCVEITDVPRFRWRGLMLDVSRHFFTKQEVKKTLDAMALHKLNTFHWHLVDDEGWRIEIKKYPKLTQIGAWRDGVGFGLPANSTTAFGPDGRYGGFYTQDDIREVVAYAAARHITVVPEIEMPAHSSAALLAYPQYLCPGKRIDRIPDKPAALHGVYCAGNDESFAFLRDIIAEFTQLFPGKYTHIGGDEVRKDNWKSCTLCQARMKAENLKDEHELQSYFIRRIEKILSEQGRRLVGWSEIREGGIAKSAVLMDWIGGGAEAAAGGNDVVMTPTAFCYINRYQIMNHAAEPLAPPFGSVPLSKVYAFEPVPAGLTVEAQSRILGAQGCVWTEYIANQKHLEYMLFPRFCALAEVTWSPKDARDFDNFYQRLPTHLKRLDAMNVNYRRLDAETVKMDKTK
jgi:hexosaminidase